MSSGGNLPNMSERDSGEDASHSRNCLGHQFDPGSNSKSKNKKMNLVGERDEMENHPVNGHDNVSEEEEDNEEGNNGRFVDMFLNHATCNGSVLVHDSSNGSVLMHDSMDVNVETAARLDKTLGCKLQNGPSNSHGCGSFLNGGCCVKPKQLDPSHPKCLQKMKKKCVKQQSPRNSRLDLPCEEPQNQPMQPHNGNMHNPNVDNQQNGVVGSNVKASGSYCFPCRQNSRPQSLWLPQIHRENRVLNGVENRQFDFDMFDMVDEGAVCDYDKFLSEEHNSPSDNSRSEETDCDFLNYHFPSTHLDCLGAVESSPKRMSKQCQYFSNSNLGHISQTVADHDTRVPDLSTVGDVDFDNSDYLKLFDEVDGEHYSAEEEEGPAAETWEDTGDFIDTDLPTRSPGLLSSSNGSSSSLSEEECASQLFYNHTYETKENDLSLIRFNTEVLKLHARSFEDDRDAEDNLYSPGNASISSSERQRAGVNHHQSSESENGEDSVSNCDVNDMCFEGGAASLDIAASSRNIQISELHNGAGGGYCLTYNASVQPGYAGFVHTDYIRGVTADCGSDPSVSCHAEQPVPPSGSASCIHSLSGVCCGVNLGVNNLSSNSNIEHSSRGCHVPVSNFQNDKSNNQQKVFIKFPISSQDRKRTIGHIKRDSSHLGSPNSPEDLYSSRLEDDAVDLPLDRYEYQQSADLTEQMVMIAAEMARTRVNAESGVSEPIYEDIEAVPEIRETENVAASGLPVDGQQKPVEMKGRKLSLKVTPRRKERRSSSIGRSGIEKVMIWNEYEAYLLQVKQIATSACGPTAVLNVLKAFDICVDKDEVCKHIHTNLRDELGCIPKYLFSRAVAGTTAEDLLSGIESLTQGKIRGRFFHFWPTRDVQLLKWLGGWMKKGAVPLATLNLQKGVKSGWTIPDAWHHQMVYGVSSKGLYLTNPLENVSEETVLEQLVSDSVLLVRRQDVVNRFREETDLGEIIRHPDDRWRTMNVLGQVVNVLRESNRPHPVYRAQLTSHISIPAVYKAGITLFVQGDSDLWQELLVGSDLPVKSPA